MRHNVYGKKLSRDVNQRTALFKSLVQSLILSESIQTTEAKAKAIKGLVDKIITQAKTPSTRRFVYQFLVKKTIQEKLVNELLPRLKDRQSGYTSVVKLGKRMGDGAMIVKMTLLTSEAPKVKADKVKAAKSEDAEVINAEVIADPVKAPKPAKTTAKKGAKA